MSKPATSPRWYRPWRQAEARVQDDPADLGTCFGLEMSLTSLAAEPPAKASAPLAPRRGWMQLLTSRRRAQA